jgi:hypothetical protein
MKRLLKTPARIAIACIALLVVLAGTSYAALARGSESSSNDAPRSAKSSLASGPAAKAAVEQRLERRRHAARPQAARAKAQAKARAHAKARKAVQKKQSGRRPVATAAARVTKPKPRVEKPASTARPSRKARRSDRSRVVRKRCGRQTSGKGSDQPAPVTPCKRSSTQPPPPPPPPLPPPPPQPGDDR